MFRCLVVSPNSLECACVSKLFTQKLMHIRIIIRYIRPANRVSVNMRSHAKYMRWSNAVTDPSHAYQKIEAHLILSAPVSMKAAARPPIMLTHSRLNMRMSQTCHASVQLKLEIELKLLKRGGHAGKITLGWPIYMLFCCVLARSSKAAHAPHIQYI